MSDLIKALEALDPIVQALATVTACANDLEEIKAKIKILEEQFEKRQNDWIMAEDSARKARVELVQANTGVIVAQARIEELSKSAGAQSEKIISDAKKEAEASAKFISDKYKSEHADLRNKIADAKAELADVERDIDTRRADHDAVMNSLASLSKRITGAA